MVGVVVVTWVSSWLRCGRPPVKSRMKLTLIWLGLCAVSLGGALFVLLGGVK